MRKFGILTVGLAVLALAVAASADVVVMNNGQTLQGTIKQHDVSRVLINIDGYDYVVPGEQVARVQYGSQSAPLSAMRGDQLVIPYYGVGELYMGPRRVIVTGTRANLRVGPGTEYSLLADVPRDSILVALGETAQWYRIVLPDGSHAWLSKSLSRMIQSPVVRNFDYFGYNYNYGVPELGWRGQSVRGVMPPAVPEMLPAQPVSPEYRAAQVAQIANQLRLTLTPAEVAELAKMLQR